MTVRQSDFTQSKYTEILCKAAEKYHFNGSDLSGDVPVACWRHDIDYSPHRALAMARFEANLGLRCVYHILPSSRYYNILEPEITTILRAIVAFGHEIGLHFDADVLGEGDRLEHLLKRIEIERGLLMSLLHCEVESFSFHNHTLHQSVILKRERIFGMRNLASPNFYSQAVYLSDSNGIWRGVGLDDLIEGPIVPKLHVLTHPLWWTPEPMSPYDKFLRVLQGRSLANQSLYLRTMQRDGRLQAIGKRIGVLPEHFHEAGLDPDGGDMK